MYSDILSGIYSDILFWQKIRRSFWHVFSPVCAQTECSPWGSGPCVPRLSWQFFWHKPRHSI